MEIQKPHPSSSSWNSAISVNPDIPFRTILINFSSSVLKVLHSLFPQSRILVIILKSLSFCGWILMVYAVIDFHIFCLDHSPYPNPIVLDYGGGWWNFPFSVVFSFFRLSFSCFRRRGCITSSGITGVLLWHRRQWLLHRQKGHGLDFGDHQSL